MTSELDERSSNHNHWVRGLYMLLFIAVFNVVELLVWLIVVYQFIATLIWGTPSERLIAFSRSLNWYVYLMLRFLTFDTEEKPFPFRGWEGRPPGG